MCQNLCVQMASSRGKGSASRDWNFTSGKTKHKIGQNHRAWKTERKIKTICGKHNNGLMKTLLHSSEKDITNPPVSETNHVIKNTLEKHIKSYSLEWSWRQVHQLFILKVGLLALLRGPQLLVQIYVQLEQSVTAHHSSVLAGIQDHKSGELYVIVAHSVFFFLRIWKM